MGINDASEIVGVYTSNTGHGFLLSDEIYTTIEPPGASNSWACDINNAGQIIGWYNNGAHGYLFDGQTYTTLDIPGALNTAATGINDNGLIVGYYQDADGNWHGYCSVSYEKYDYTCYYGNGDFYTGSVYAATNYGYEDGDTLTFTDENGQSGYYEITGVTAGDYADLVGQTNVTSYYDAGSGHTYTLTDNNLFATSGTSGLGSESGYIITSGYADYHFGTASHYEAEVVAYAYAFTYTYSDGSGDSYTGTVYAAPENAPTGTGYTVAAGTLAAEGLAAEALWGRVNVSSYYDGESQRTFADAGTNLFVTPGASGLASETGYIVKTGVDDFYFGGAAHAEADLAACYTYTFTYSNGDYYTGSVYASEDQYSVDQTWSIAAEQGLTGQYKITGVAYLEDTSNYGQVTVDNYYDVEMQRVYTPTFVFNLGDGYLGNESGFININNYPDKVNPDDPSTMPTGISKFYFGYASATGIFYEADVKASSK